MKTNIHIIAFFLILMVFPAGLFGQDKEKGKKRGRNTEANSMLDKKAATEVFIDGTKARLLGDYEKAATSFKRSLELDPTNDAAMFELSQIYFAKGDYTGAIQLIENAVAIDPDNPYYRLISIDMYGKSGRKEDVLKACQYLVKHNPGNVEYLYELAAANLMSGKSDDALDAYDKIEEIIGVTEEISMQKQRIYMLLEKYEKATFEIEKLIEAYPEETGRYFSMLAEIQMQAGKTEKAAEYYRKIIEVDPDNPYVHISLSDYYRKKGDLARSFDELKAGFANPGLDVDTKIRLMMAYYSVQELYNEKKDEANTLSDIILKTHPGDSKAIALNGDFLMNGGKYEEARERFRQVLAVDSSRYAVWESLLQANAMLADWSSLSEESSRAMDLFPFQPLPYYFGGLALLQLKNTKEAIRVLNSGAKLVTSNDQLLVQFYTYLGDAYNQSGEHARSDEHYEKALKIDPENSYVLNNYAYYLSLRKEDLEKALVMARKAVSLDSLNPANLDTYGWVYYQMGRYEEAKTWVEKAILASAKEDPDLLEHFGDILYRLGEESRAIEYWEKASRAGQGSEQLEKKLKSKRIIE